MCLVAAGGGGGCSQHVGLTIAWRTKKLETNLTIRKESKDNLSHLVGMFFPCDPLEVSNQDHTAATCRPRTQTKLGPPNKARRDGLAMPLPGLLGPESL